MEHEDLSLSDPPAPAPAAEEAGDPSPVTEWPAEIVDQHYELIELPSGATVRVDHHVSYGDLLVASVVTLLLVVEVGRMLFDRVRGVL